MEKVKVINLMVGNDNGNSEHDLIINGDLIKQPNVHSKIRTLPYLEELKEEKVVENIEDNLIVTVDSPVAELGKYIVGNYALGSGERVRSIEVGVDNNKIESNIVYVNTLAQISGYACKKAFKENNNSFEGLEEIEANVLMATALPITQYNKKNAAEFEDKFMQDTHLVTVHIASKRILVKVKFDFVKVIPEGVTTVWALQKASDEVFEEYNKNNPDNKINKDFFKSAKVLHVAIGEGTTEYPITKGIEFNPNFIDGSNNGIGHAIDNSLDEFIDKVGLTNYSRQKYSELLKDNTHRYYDRATEISSQYIEEQAEEIEHRVKKQIQRINNEVDIVVVYGGGSILMKSHLYNKLKTFCDRAEIKLLYVPGDYAVTLEAEGLYNFASSKIFDKIREIKKADK